MQLCLPGSLLLLGPQSCVSRVLQVYTLLVELKQEGELGHLKGKGGSFK